MSNNNSSIKTVDQLSKLLDKNKLYSRQEVAAVVGCIWANVLDAAKGSKPKLVGTLVQEGKVQTWKYTADQILNWRRSVEERTGKASGQRVVIAIESDEDLAELKKLLAGSKFEKMVG